jgi:hypothetical protein
VELSTVAGVEDVGAPVKFTLPFNVVIVAVVIAAVGIVTVPMKVGDARYASDV